MSWPTRALSFLVVLASLSACAVAPPVSEDERRLIDRMTGERLAPRSAEARAEVANADLVAQVSFWTNEYEQNPADLEAARAFADVSRKIGNPARAARVASQALTLKPDDSGLLITLGAALIEDGRAAAAVEPLAKAAALDPSDWVALNRLGAALDHQGEHEEARARYRDALAVGGERLAIRANLGVSYLISGDAFAAEEELRRALQLPGADVRVRQNLALALALQGRFPEAEALAQHDQSREVAEQNVAAVRAMIAPPARWDRLRAAYDD